MNRMAWGLALAACRTDGTENDVAQVPVDAPVQQTMVVEGLGFVVAEDGVTEGFDLDGEVSDASSPLGCGREDYVDPEGVEGIDNAFADLVPILQATEASALESLLAQSIANGELLVLFDVIDPDGDCQLTIAQGVGTPLLGSDGTLLDRQTFRSELPVTTPCVRLDDGSVEARGFAVDIPLRVLNLAFTLHLADAAARLQVAGDGTASGILAGGIPISDFEVILAEDNIEQLGEFLTPIVAGLMDLYPQPDGSCAGMSVSLAFDALPAFIAEE